MAHNGYIYPEDVVIKWLNGKQVARIGWELPVIWTKEALAACEKVNFLTEWEMARQAFRQEKMDTFLRNNYPDHWTESLQFRAHIASGGSVTSFHQGMAQ